MSASEFFCTFCAFAPIYANLILKTDLLSRENLGLSRTGGAAALSREPSEFFGPKLFPRSRRPSEKISQTAMRIIRGRLLDPIPSPPPGKWTPGPRTPGPLRSESVSGWAQISKEISLIWSHARHTFCNSGKFRFFGGGAPVPLRSLDPCGEGPWVPLLRRTHGKNVASFCMPGTLFVTPKNSDPFCNFSTMPKWCLAQGHFPIIFHHAKVLSGTLKNSSYFPSCQSGVWHTKIVKFSTQKKVKKFVKKPRENFFILRKSIIFVVQ